MIIIKGEKEEGDEEEGKCLMLAHLEDTRDKERPLLNIGVGHTRQIEAV